MESSRLPRFRRISPTASLQLTGRDRNILRLVFRYRFLRTSQIVALMDDRSQQLRRRLQTLYHHGYLERPRSQLDYYHQSGNQSLVYCLGNKGGTLIRQELVSAQPKLSWGEKNRAVGRIFLEHSLLVSEVMAALELACRASGSVRLLTEEQLSVQGKLPFQWRVELQGGSRLGVIPDRVFALEFLDETGANERIYFFLEADRGTMPVKRRHLSQTSFYRKLLAYEATWSQSVHKKKFGFNRFRVLTVTTSPARVESLVDACSGLKTGHGLFLFGDTTVLEKPESILTRLWQTPRLAAQTTLVS